MRMPSVYKYKDMILVVQKGCQAKKAYHIVWDIPYVTYMYTQLLLREWLH